MTRSCSSAAVIGVALAVALSGSADASPRQSRCHFRGATRVHQTSEAVIVYTRHRIRTHGKKYIRSYSYVGCVKRTGRTTELENDTYGLIDYARLVGHIAAVNSWPDCDAGCQGSDEFRVVDLSTGQRIFFGSWADPESIVYYFHDAALDAFGNFAAVRTREGTEVDIAPSRLLLYKPRFGHKQILDRGMGIGAHSLRRVGRTYYWRHNHRVRSFTP